MNCNELLKEQYRINNWLVNNLLDFSSFYSKIQFIIHWNVNFLPLLVMLLLFLVFYLGESFSMDIFIILYDFSWNLYAYPMLSIHHFKIIPPKYSNRPSFVYFLNSTYKPGFCVQSAPINFGNSNTLRNQSKTHSKFKIYQRNSKYQNRSASQKP